MIASLQHSHWNGFLSLWTLHWTWFVCMISRGVHVWYWNWGKALYCTGTFLNNVKWIVHFVLKYKSLLLTLGFWQAWKRYHPKFDLMELKIYTITANLASYNLIGQKWQQFFFFPEQRNFILTCWPSTKTCMDLSFEFKLVWWWCNIRSIAGWISHSHMLHLLPYTMFCGKPL